MDLTKPAKNSTGRFVPTRTTVAGRCAQYYLSTSGTVEADEYVKEPLKTFYFVTEELAYDAIIKYYDDWGVNLPRIRFFTNQWFSNLNRK